MMVETRKAEAMFTNGELDHVFFSTLVFEVLYLLLVHDVYIRQMIRVNLFIANHALIFSQFLYFLLIIL